MWYQNLILGFILSFVLVGIAVKVFPKLGLLDFPQRYGLDRQRLPYPGGLVLLGLAFGMWFVGGGEFLKLLPALIWIGVVSFVDDRKGLSVGIRSLVYVLAIVWVFYNGIKIDFVGIPWQETNWELADKFWLSLGVTVFWVFMIQQAMNWFDGLQGLCVGVSGIGFLTLGILGLVRPELFFDSSHASLTTVNLYLAGLCLGGWIWFWKEKIILGDTGSQVLGFLLGVMAIWSGAKIMTTLIVLALPLIDVLLVVFRRVLIDKSSPFQGDGKHLHHNLMYRIGASNASLILLSCSIVLGGMAIFLSGMMKLLALGIVGICIVLFGLFLLKSERAS